MTRAEFAAAYREARKVNRFACTFARHLPGWPWCSLVGALPPTAWQAACRYGDPLAFPHWRQSDGRYHSRVR